jgi:hypothetical protein
MVITGKSCKPPSVSQSNARNCKVFPPSVALPQRPYNEQRPMKKTISFSELSQL